jgi:hypothetical protein
MGKGKISRSASCAGYGRRHEFSGRPQLRGIGLRHAADIAVLEGAATCPFHHFADALFLSRGNAPCRGKEFVTKLVEPGTCGRSVTIDVTGCWGGPLGGRLSRSVPPSRGGVVYRGRCRSHRLRRRGPVGGRLARSVPVSRGSDPLSGGRLGLRMQCGSGGGRIRRRTCRGAGS